MEGQNCSCCNRTFPPSELRHHAVGGGVRDKNEWLCVDCWRIFVSAPWEEGSALGSNGGASIQPRAHPAASAERAQRQEASAPAQNDSEAKAVVKDDAAGPPASSAAQVIQTEQPRAQSLGELKRLSGGGDWQRPLLAAQIPSKESFDKCPGQAAAAADKLSAAATKQEKPAEPEGPAPGPVLKRDRSGRFMSRKTGAAGAEGGAARNVPTAREGLGGAAKVESAAEVVPAPAQGTASEITGPMGPAPGVALREALDIANRERGEAVERSLQLQSQVASLETCLRSARMQVMCTVCNRDRRCALALPCGHLLYCSACMAAQQASSGSCGKCAARITNVQSVFLS